MELELIIAGTIAIMIILLLEATEGVYRGRNSDYIGRRLAYICGGVMACGLVYFVSAWRIAAGAASLLIIWIGYITKVRHLLCFQREFYVVIAFTMRRILIDKQEGEKCGLRVC
jgi:hypothetical protein